MKASMLVRIQDNGQVTLPAELCKRLGLKKGDLVALVETRDGVLVTRQEVLATKALDRIGDILGERGYSLEDLIDSGREERGALVAERYGEPPDRPPR